jgi:hypothetical protein
MLEKLIQEMSWHSWNWLFVESNNENRKTDQIKLISDHNKETKRTSFLLESGKKHKTKAPIAGKTVKDSSIIFKSNKIRNSVSNEQA